MNKRESKLVLLRWSPPLLSITDKHSAISAVLCLFQVQHSDYSDLCRALSKTKPVTCVTDTCSQMPHIDITSISHAWLDSNVAHTRFFGMFACCGSETSSAFCLQCRHLCMIGSIRMVSDATFCGAVAFSWPNSQVRARLSVEAARTQKGCACIRW